MNVTGHDMNVYGNEINIITRQLVPGSAISGEGNVVMDSFLHDLH